MNEYIIIFIIKRDCASPQLARPGMVIMGRGALQKDKLDVNNIILSLFNSNYKVL